MRLLPAPMPRHPVLRLLVLRLSVLRLLAAVLCLSAPSAAIVTDLSQHRIEIRYSFDGADLILFGTVGDSPVDPLRGDFDVVIVVRGPETPTVVRRKGRVGGIWVNTDSVTFSAAPGYYAVAASRPLADIAAPLTYARSGIGFENLRLAIEGGPSQERMKPDFMEALYRRRTEAGLYRQELDTVTMVGQGLFRTDVRLPANVPVGEFFVDTFIFQQGELKGRNRIDLTVDKEGFERAVFTFANVFPFFYGLAAVMIALMAGWLASFVGRK
ncbi:TIGR02186 family protein [Eilatimonas milleporae]|uniref:Uncharacterized protein (TIGR02186 family) n=1 Tax=Eilatimonas milleporae TaxID=911205 RepID=A0A3M0BYX1_9PROT|nr:TIGR02186 family protein [Eilatimonas milleporae]RMB02771.1 uncharacterized protein (TIGR02186 family) [Eilatimonas milleporae]